MKMNCIFCGTVCKNFLDHLKKYHQRAIDPFPNDETQASKYFKNRRYH